MGRPGFGRAVSISEAQMKRISHTILKKWRVVPLDVVANPDLAAVEKHVGADPGGPTPSWDVWLEWSIAPDC